MEFKILSRYQAQNFTSNKKYIMISVNSVTSFRYHHNSKPELKNDDNRIDTLYLYFDDVDCEKHGVIFTNEMAISILNFVFFNINNIEQIVCHCTAGISRSAAIIASLMYILKYDNSEIFRNKVPNMVVWKTILQEYYKD